MIPAHMQIKGFLSYQDDEIDFTGFNLACISGTNGAGKSSLLDAMTWVLFGNARRNDDAIINTASESARVVFEFLYEGETYCVTREKFRNKTGTLEFNVRKSDGGWNVLTAESMRLTETRIRDTLKMDYETFINASFFLQGKADLFAQQRPADRKRILGSILGLERWEAYQMEATTRRKAVQSEIDQLDGRVEEINTELGEEEQRKQRLEALENECEQVSRERGILEASVQSHERLEIALKSQNDAIFRMENDLKTITARRDQLDSSMNDRQKEISETEILLADEAQIEEQYRQWDSLRSEKERLEALASRHRQLDMQRQSPLREIAEEKGRLQQQAAGLQPAQDEIAASTKELESLEKNLAPQEARYATLSALAESRPDVERERVVVLDAKARLEAENDSYKTTMQEYRERIDQLQAAVGADCPLCGQALTPDHRQELLASLEKEGRALADTYRVNQQRIKEKTAENTALESQLEECTRAGREAQEIRRGLDAALSRIEMLKQKIQDFTADVTNAGAARDLLETELYATEARAAVSGLTREMESLGFEPAKLEAVTRQEAEIRTVAEMKQAIAGAKARLEPLKREISSLREQYSETTIEITRREKELSEARKHLEEQSKGLPDLAALRQNLFDLKDKENQLRANIGGARQNVQVLETQRKRLLELTEKRHEYTRQIARLKMLEKAFGKDGVQALLIEEALPEIETQANEILDGLSGGNMSVQFSTQKEYKDRNRDDKRETLDILISDGAGIRAYELFSGGEAFRVNFSIRLALSRVLANRAGARLQTLVVDEGFGSQDVDGRQKLIETINHVKPDFAKILVITHLEELKDAFPARIEVEKTAQNGSKVSVYNDYA